LFCFSAYEGKINKNFIGAFGARDTIRYFPRRHLVPLNGVENMDSSFVMGNFLSSPTTENKISIIQATLYDYCLDIPDGWLILNNLNSATDVQTFDTISQLFNLTELEGEEQAEFQYFLQKLRKQKFPPR